MINFGERRGRRGDRGVKSLAHPIRGPAFLGETHTVRFYQNCYTTRYGSAAAASSAREYLPERLSRQGDISAPGNSYKSRARKDLHGNTRQGQGGS